MSLAQQKRYEFNEFGGICSLTTAGDTPPEMSPDTQNTMFFPGGVRSRDVFRTYLTDPEGRITYFHTYITPNGNKYRIMFYDTGAIKIEHPETTLRWLYGGPGTSTGTFVAASRPLAATLFGKAFIALGDGSKGVELPRQYSPTLNALYPVAPDAPGKAPQMNAGYPAAVAAPATGFNMVTAAAGPPIVAGSVVNLVICFKTKTGFITAPSPPLPVLVAADGTYSFQLQNMPIGPSYVTERLIFATPSTGGTEYFHIPGGGMQVKDNTTTTSAIFGYSDSVLQSGTPLSLVTGNPLPAISGVSTYGDRLVAWGGTNTLPNFLSAKTSSIGVVAGTVGTYFGAGYMQGPINWRFEGGSTAGAPNGWAVTADAVATIGAITNDAAAVGDCWRWTGGAAATNILSSATVPITTVDGVLSPFLPGITYNYRLRIRRSAGATGTLRVTGTANWDIDVATQIGTDWGTVEGGSAIVNPVLRMTVAPPAGEWIELDWIQAFEEGYPYERSIVRVSNPQGDCEVFSDANLISVAPDDGQEIRNVFELRGNLYIVKERSLYYTKNTGDVASQWPIDIVSSSVGTRSIYGVGLGDGFAIIAGAAGVYLFSGGKPSKLSAEIDDMYVPAATGSDQWVAVDHRNQFFLAKSGAVADSVSSVFHCNYWMGMESGITSSGRGRKWSRWKVGGQATEITPRAAIQPSYGAVTVRDDDSLSVLVTGDTKSSNYVVNTSSSTFDGTATFPPAALADQWYALTGAAPGATVTGLSDPFGGTLAWSWADGGGFYSRGIYSGQVTGVNSFGAIYLKASVSTEVTLEIRYYSTTSTASPYTCGPIDVVTVGTDWVRLGESTLQYGSTFTGYRVLVVSYSGPVTMSVCAPSVQGAYDHGYVPNTSGVAVTGVKTSLVKSLAPFTFQDGARVQNSVGKYPAYDCDNSIPSYYVTPPIGSGAERTAITASIERAWGAGNLQHDTYKPYPYLNAPGAAIALVAGPTESMEVLIGGSDGLVLNASTASLKIGVSQQNLGWWYLSKVTVLCTESLTPLRLAGG